MLNYQAIEIFTSEEARSRNKPVTDAVLQYVHDLKIAARCIVTRGIAGCYESGEMATTRLEILSFNLPVRIYIILPAMETDRVLDGLNGIVSDGIIALHDLRVLSHRAHNAFFPRQLMVRDVMTPNPKRVATDTSASEAARMLLESIFTGLPVVDKKNRPVGVITQGDLIARGGLPLRLGLLAESGHHRREALLDRMAVRRSEEIMTQPAVVIAGNRLLTEAVDLMLTKGIKRLPVVDQRGCLTGMLSRLDIFRTVMREAPDWKAFQAQKVEVSHLKRVGDIARRDIQTVPPETSVDEVIRIIDRNDIQRVAVVDAQGTLLGLISDRDLLRFFKQQEDGILGLLAKVKHPFKHDSSAGDRQPCLVETHAAAVMTTELITVREATPIEEAIHVMTETGLKRLPVIDTDNRFRGMISRDSLLRTGFSTMEAD